MDYMSTKVSFIIPALNEEERIASLIDNIKMLDPEYNYEIIVADGNSTDKTAEIAQKSGATVIKITKMHQGLLRMAEIPVQLWLLVRFSYFVMLTP